MEGFWKSVKNHTGSVVLLLMGAVYLFLKYICPLVTPILLAMLFVTIFGPLLQKLQKKLHLHRQVGAAGVLFLALAVVAALLWILGMWLLQSVPGWIRDLEQISRDMEGMAGEMCRGILSQVKNLTLPVGDGAALQGEQVQANFFESLLSGGREFLPYFVRYGGKLALFGGGLVTFFIAVVLLAKDYDEMMNRLLEREDCYLLLEVICGVIRYLATFVRAQGIIIALIALLCSAVLWTFGISQGVFWGILAGLLDALPFIGTGVVLIPLGILEVLQGFYLRGVVCGVLYVCCIILREMLEPRLIGKRMGVRPIFILGSLYIGIRLFGPWGIIKGPLGFIILRETWQHLREDVGEK